MAKFADRELYRRLRHHCKFESLEERIEVVRAIRKEIGIKEKMTFLANGAFGFTALAGENLVLKFSRAADKGYTAFIKYIQENRDEFPTALPKIHGELVLSNSIKSHIRINPMERLKPQSMNAQAYAFKYMENYKRNKPRLLQDNRVSNNQEFMGLVDSLNNYRKVKNLSDDMHAGNIMIRNDAGNKYQLVMTDPFV